MNRSNPYAATDSTCTPIVPPARHPLRIPSVATLAVIGCLIPLQPDFLLTVLAFTAFNGVFSLILTFAAGPRYGAVAFLATVFFIATLLFTDWGFSTPKPVVRVHWMAFVPATLLMIGWIAWPLFPASVPVQSGHEQDGG